MKHFFAFLMLVGFSFLGKQAFALDFTLEPFVGYQMGTFQAGSDSGSLNGIGYGSRLGANFAWIDAGVDVRFGSVTRDPSNSNVTTQFFKEEVGLFLMLSLPATPASFWISYAFLDHLLPDFSAETNRGSSFRLGAGWKSLPYLRFALEVAFKRYSEKDNGAGVITPIDPNLVVTEFFISAGIPFEFSF